MNAQLNLSEELCSDADVAARTGRPLSGTVELCAAPEPISGAAVSRPVYDNTYVRSREDWLVMNSGALLQWWNAGEHDDKDFHYFCLNQHEYELTKHEKEPRGPRASSPLWRSGI